MNRQVAMTKPDAPPLVSTDDSRTSASQTTLIGHRSDSSTSIQLASTCPTPAGLVRSAQIPRTRVHLQEPGAFPQQAPNNTPDNPRPTSTSATCPARASKYAVVRPREVTETSPRGAGLHEASVIHQGIQGIPHLAPKVVESHLHFREHPLFRCLCELSVFRHRASVTTALAASQEVFADAISCVESHFTQSAALRLHQAQGAATDSTARVVDECIRAAIMTLLAHIAEYHHHCASAQVALGDMGVRASSRFAGVMSEMGSPQHAAASSSVAAPQSPSVHATEPALPTCSPTPDDLDSRDVTPKDGPSTSGVPRQKSHPHHPRVKRLLQGWLDRHSLHPFPDEEQKTLLAQLTGLNRVQVDNWFVNARRRRRKQAAAAVGHEDDDS